MQWFLAKFRQISFMHCIDVTMGEMASQITSLAVVYSTVYSGVDQRKHQSSASLAFVRGIHRGPMKSPHKGPATRKIFPFDDVIIGCHMVMTKLFKLIDNHIYYDFFMSNYPFIWCLLMVYYLDKFDIILPNAVLLMIIQHWLYHGLGRQYTQMIIQLWAHTLFAAQ